MKQLRKTAIFLLFATLVACSLNAPDETMPLVIPTAVSQTVVSQTVVSQTNDPISPTLPPPSPTAIPVPSPTMQPTAQPPATPTPVPVVPVATNTPAPPETLYQVAFVTAGDLLNVRSGPGVGNDIVGTLAADADSVRITGSGQLVSGSTWFPIAANDVIGWVNGRFLTTAMDSPSFCQDESVLALLDALKTAVADQDAVLLSKLIHPERGLRLRYSWWNPEIRLSGNDIITLFTSPRSYDWGVQDGSDFPIIGPFNQEILPLLQADLLPATETACDEIRHGGTAGLVQLPDGYQQHHFYSLHRPGTEEYAGMDWGSWVVGVEQWQGQYYISYLVHFAWEI